jgi:hypothetical protein
VISLIDGISLTSIVKKHNADYYYKAFKGKTHLITVLFGILSRCDSMTEICEGLRAMGGKLNHLGLEKAPAKSTASDGMRNRDNPAPPVSPNKRKILLKTLEQLASA